MSQQETLKNLQTALSMELTAMHQYQLHASVLDDWGMDRLAAKMREEMQEELGHSDEYLARLTFRKGTPELKLQKTPVLAKSLKEMFELDLADEQEAIEFYTTSAKQASDERDIGSRMLFERIAIDEEGHMSWLELQLDLLKRMGEPAYIAKHITVSGEHETA
ncbi:bacterioferritin [Planctomycetes bacterium K23_9]|uniref:Bacterioferritin n=1 Tax=Stieleria marina TaxID=1930275 RepID=A0A517P004_9BACT|nr:Bacterioferritin [Planctomycetes bacterium K23_9]